eukprot:scaffold344_cov130-Cylindrotheca_fusiformis.AAC.15
MEKPDFEGSEDRNITQSEFSSKKNWKNDSMWSHVLAHLKHSDTQDELNSLERFWFVLAYLLLFALGLCSFGQLWPKRIRLDVFGRNKGTATVKEELALKKTSPEVVMVESKIAAAAATTATAAAMTSDIQKSLIHRTLDDRSKGMDDRIAKLEMKVNGLDDKLGNVQELLQHLIVSQQQRR